MTTKEPVKKDKDDYILLPTKFSESGWNFEFFKDLNDEWKIYIRTKSNGEGRKHYELVRILKQEEFNFQGKIIPKKYKYPTTSSFGRLGYDCIDEGRCLQIFDLIKNKKEEEDNYVPVNQRPLVIPNSKNFTIKDLTLLNPSWNTNDIRNKVKFLLETKVIEQKGEKENERGKPSKIYRKLK